MVEAVYVDRLGKEGQRQRDREERHRDGER